MADHLENILVALEALKANRLRTFLTLLGIIIGVAAVVMVGAAVRSGQTVIFNELETFGLKSLWVYRSFDDNQPGKTTKSGSGIENDDLEAIAGNSYPGACRIANPYDKVEAASSRLNKRQDGASTIFSDRLLVKRIAPVIEKSLWAKYGNNFIKAKFLATGPDYAEINNDYLTGGRFLVPEDIKLRRSVCVIGKKVKDMLFSNQDSYDPLGEEVRIGRNKYTVVGILKEKSRDFLSSIGSAGGQEANNRVIIPISTYQHHYNTKSIGYIQAEAITISQAKAASEEIKNILYHRHKGQYVYDSQSMQQYIETVRKIVQGVAWIGAIAAIVSLVVGGIGIMNIMTVSVVERTREIGLRKALGARKADILIQFLSESVFISFLGGIIGVGIGITLILLIQWLGQKPRLLAPEYAVAALAVSLLTGVFSGFYPAHRAASLDPVEALRYE